MHLVEFFDSVCNKKLLHNSLSLSLSLIIMTRGLSLTLFFFFLVFILFFKLFFWYKSRSVINERVIEMTNTLYLYVIDIHY